MRFRWSATWLPQPPGTVARGGPASENTYARPHTRSIDFQLTWSRLAEAQKPSACSPPVLLHAVDSLRHGVHVLIEPLLQYRPGKRVTSRFQWELGAWSFTALTWAPPDTYDSFLSLPWVGAPSSTHMDPHLTHQGGQRRSERSAGYCLPSAGQCLLPPSELPCAHGTWWWFPVLVLVRCSGYYTRRTMEVAAKAQFPYQ